MLAILLRIDDFDDDGSKMMLWLITMINDKLILTFKSISPLGLTGKYVTSCPSASKARQESRTHLCSYFIYEKHINS